jgi:hypothetical protein
MGEATDAALKCFAAWYEYFRNYDPLSRSVSKVGEFISSNTERFQELGGALNLSTIRSVTERRACS